MAIKHLKADSKIQHILEVLYQDAGLVIDDVVSSNDLKKIKNELAPYLKNNLKGDNEFTGFQTKRVGALMARSPTCRELALNPVINQVSQKFLEPHCDGYQLHFTSAISIGPGESQQVLHRDLSLIHI